MLKYLSSVSIIIFVIQLSANAQLSFSGGYSRIYDQVFWDHGASMQIEYVTPIKYGHASISCCGGYSYFFNTNKLPNLAIPDIWAFVREFSVKPFQIVDILIKTKYQFSDSDFHLFVSLGLGASYHSVNPVQMREYYTYSNLEAPSFSDYNSFQYALEPIYQLAICYNIPITSNYSIGPQLSYCRNLSTCLNRFLATIFIAIK